MENQNYSENARPEELGMPDESSKTFEAANASRAQKLKTSGGAEPFEQSADHQRKHEFKQTLANLISIPMEVFQMVNLRHLDLSNNAICFIPDDIQKLTFLQYLDLSYNNLTTLPNPLVQSSWLTNLNLSHNNFTQVPIALYKSAPCVKILDMSYNYISEFPDPPLCENYLEVLILSSNLLKSIPRWIFDLKNLNYIDLFNNALTHVPSNFLQERVIVHLSRGIKFLNLQNCQVTTEKLNFVSTILDLETLALSNTFDVDDEHRNSMHYLNPSLISRAKSLKHLHASNVDLFFLHNNIDSLQCLQRIDLSFNGLMWLPNSFCELTNLTECKLTSNSITFLPPDFGKLVNLKIIFLNENNLVELPRSFVLLVNLEVCDLYNNQLEKFDLRILKMRYLRGLDLEDNCLDLHALQTGEQFRDYNRRYNALKDNFRREMGVTRVDGQRASNIQRPSTRSSPNATPDFVADYPSCEVYGLNSDTETENREAQPANPQIYHESEGTLSFVSFPRPSPNCPLNRPGPCDCRYCHFLRPALIRRHTRPPPPPPPVRQQPPHLEPEPEPEPDSDAEPGLQVELDAEEEEDAQYNSD